MTLAHGHPILAIPGPSMFPDRVLAAMHRPAINIYSGPLIDLTYSVLADLKTLAGTAHDAAIYISNGHGGWEGALVNTLAPGEKCLVLSNGRFGQGWADMATRLGIQAEVMDCGTLSPVDPARLEARLREDRAGEIRSVLVTQTDTSSSVMNDIPALSRAIRAAGHDALLQVDAIASFACEPMHMDDWGVDVLLAGCQKGLMTPPGLAFNFISDRALAARRRLDIVSPYFDWIPRLEPQIFYQHFCGTPPTHHLYGLREALDMIAEEGVENVWARHETIASLLWAAADVWSEQGEVRLNVTAPEARSRAVTTLHTGAGDAERLRSWTEAEAGVVLGIGLGLGGPATPPTDSLFRVGHMGHLSPHGFLGTLAVIDAGLKALDIPHGGGALRVASDRLAQAVSQAR